MFSVFGWYFAARHLNLIFVNPFKIKIIFTMHIFRRTEELWFIWTWSSSAWTRSDGPNWFPRLTFNIWFLVHWLWICRSGCRTISDKSLYVRGLRPLSSKLQEKFWAFSGMNRASMHIIFDYLQGLTQNTNVILISPENRN